MTKQSTWGIDPETELAMAALLRPPFSYSAGPLRVADMYPGTGETALATKRMGLDVIYAVEPDYDKRLAYFKTTRVRPKQEVPLLLKELPDVDILVVHLSADDVSQDELLRKHSRFQEAARILRVKRPPGVVVSTPAETDLWEILEELRILGYGADRDGVAGRLLVVGVQEKQCWDWPLVGLLAQ